MLAAAKIKEKLRSLFIKDTQHYLAILYLFYSFLLIYIIK
jgi:hypothetical protein